MIEVPSSPDRVVVVGEFEGFAPEELFDYFVEPTKLVQWWPQVVTNDPREGGAYRFEWPQPGYYLHGTYTAFARGEHLGFTWTWNHDPGTYEPLQVDLYFQAIDGGTRLGIHHGPFAGEDTAARQGVIEGWIHFGMRLAGLRIGDAV